MATYTSSYAADGAAVDASLNRADSALQPADVSAGTLTPALGNVTLRGSLGQVLGILAGGSVGPVDPVQGDIEGTLRWVPFPTSSTAPGANGDIAYNGAYLAVFVPPVNRWVFLSTASVVPA